MDKRSLISRGALAWLLLVILWLTWSPFLLREEAARIVLRPPASPVDLIGNLVLYVPLAFVAGVPTVRRTLRELAPIWALLVCASIFVELGQLWIVRRFVSPHDVLLNAAGAGGALWVGSTLRRRFREEQLILGTVLMVWIATLSFLGLRTIRAIDGTRLTEWKSDFSVAVADEVGGERPYRGTIREARICVPGEDPACVSGGADLATRERLVRAAQREQRLRIVATVTSTTPAQTGPARIITFSDGTSRRNVTLGQLGRSLVLRLRTPVAGINGSELVYPLRNAVPTDRTIRIRATYDHGRVTLTADRDGVLRSSAYSPNPLLLWTWVVGGRRVEAGHDAQIVAASLIGALLILLPPLLVTAWFRGRSHSGVPITLQ